LFVVVFPLLAFTAHLTAVLETDSVHPANAMHCDNTSPLWYVTYHLPESGLHLNFIFCLFQASSLGLRRRSYCLIYTLLCSVCGDGSSYS